MMNNIEANMKAIDNYLDEIREQHAEFFGQKRVVILLASLARYSKSRKLGAILGKIFKER